MATTTFNDLITFSRGSNATVTGPNGLIQWAPANLLTNSQDFEAAAWSKVNATVSANATVAPDGTTTADEINEGVATGNHYIQVSTSPSSGATYVVSVYAKAGTTGFLQILYDGITGTNDFCNFDLTNGTVGTGTGGQITSVGNGWYRCSITGTSDATQNGLFLCVASSASAPRLGGSFTGTGKTLFLWGAQLEIGSTATTYNNTSVRNLLGFSEAFDNAAWTKTRASIVTGAQSNPVNGLFNAQKLMVDTATGSHRVISGAGATASGTRYTFSVYIKQGEYAKAAIGEFNNGVGWASFDLQAGTVLATGGTGSPSASITTAGSGWFRCAVTCTVGAFSRLDIYALNAAYTTADPSVYSYTGDGNSGVYIYGAQLSNSASLDPYVPTPGAAPSSTAYYGPRFDYDPVTLLPRGLLIEEQRVNLLTYSDDFGNAVWAKVNITVTTNVTTAPDGTSTADLVTYTGLGFGPRQSASTSPSAKTYSYYVKSSGGSRYFQILTDGSVQSFANFDIQTQTTGTVGTSVSSASVVSVGDGWYRLIMTATDASATSPYVGLVSGLTAGWSTGVTTGAFFIWGAQLEAGAFATSYIPTIASTVTRSADIAVITGSLFSQWYNGVEGSFVVDVDSVKNSGNPYGSFVVNDGTSNNRMAVIGNLSGTSAVIFGATGGVDQFNVQGIAATTVGIPYKMSLAYAVNNFATSGNGGAVATDTLGSVPTVNRMDLGYFFPGTPATNILNGHIRSIRYVPVRAADFQLQELTAQSIVDYAFLQTASGDQLVDGNGDYLYSIPIFG